MQVRVKAPAVVNYDGQILDVNPDVTYDGAFAKWLHDSGHDIDVVEADPEDKPARKTRTKAE